jgi:hypothetical protein
MLLTAGWVTAAITFAAGWGLRARLNARSSAIVLERTPRVRGRLRHGGFRPRSSALRCRHVRRGMRRVRPVRIHDRPATVS